MAADVPRETLAVVVGRNCERLRTMIGLTQDELARYARDLGLRWKASSVGDFEAGRSAPKFATVMIVIIALQWALEDVEARDPKPPGERPGGVSLSDLMQFDGLVMLSDTFEVFGSLLVDACRGYVPTLDSPLYDLAKAKGGAADAVVRLLQQSGLTEERQAKRMGIDPARLAFLSLGVWGTTFSRERDRRAGTDANQQKRGQVTRAMQIELDEAQQEFALSGEIADLANMERWADGDDQ